VTERSDLSGAGADEAGELLDQLLDPLLDDFAFWFGRGRVLLEHCPDAVMPPEERAALAEELESGGKTLLAARSLRAAAPVSMALDLQAMAPWHHLVMRCWALAARLRQAGVILPPFDPEP
jgi:hypothetical protein